MKNSIYGVTLITLMACNPASEKKSEESKVLTEEEKKAATVEQEKNGECYRYESPCEMDGTKTSTCTLTITIQDQIVQANTYCLGCGDTVETFYRGVKHADTLILDQVEMTKEGNERLTKTYWIQTGDQLNQLVTERKNGKVILKEQTTHTFLASYVKVACD